MNLLLDDGPLLALLPEAAPLHPWALNVRLGPATLAPPLSVFTEGTEVLASARGLEIGSRCIGLEDVEVVDLRLRIHPGVLPADAVRALSQFVRATTTRETRFDAVLCDALLRFQAGGAVEDLVYLVGLGQGLTPSGDDALVGILAGLDLARDASSGAWPLRAALAAALATRISDRTPRLSAQMLAAAADGLYAEPVLRLLEVLAGEDDALTALDPVVQALARMGQRSGLDTLCGLVAALGRA